MGTRAGLGEKARRRRSMISMAGVLLLGSIVVNIPAVSATDPVDFPAYMHDAAHSAYSPDATAITPSSTLSTSWIFKADKVSGHPSRGFVSTPIVVNHVIYIGSNTGDFYAIDELTGQTIWKKDLGFEAGSTCGNARGFAATATSGIDPGSGELRVYAASGDGYLYALRASDGKTRWKSAVNVPTPGVNDYFNYSSPEIANGHIYIGISSFCDNPLVRAGVVSLDQGTGHRLARFYTVPKGTVGGSIWSSPAVAADGSVIITTGNATDGALIGTAQSIVRLDGTTLQLIGSYQLVTRGGDSDFGGAATVFTADINEVPTDMVGACNKDGFYYAWKLDDIAAGPVWKIMIGVTGHRGGGEICISGAIWDGTSLYMGGTPTTIDGVLYRGSMRKLDPATGISVWETGLPAAVMTSPTMDGSGAIAAASFDYDDSVPNSAFLIDSTTGAYTVIDDGGVRAAPSPVFADDYLLVATSAGRIYAYQVAP